MMNFSKCLVCSNPSNGLHFDVYSCRACAAFFRRAVLKKYGELKCRKDDQKYKHSLDSCKKCRLEKCYEVGMNDKKMQLGRDAMSSTERQNSGSLDYIVGRPTFITFSSSRCQKSAQRNFIDFTKLIEKGWIILESQSKIYVGMNTLTQLSYALTKSRKPPKQCRKIGRNDILKIWEIGFLKVAEWFKYCDKFQEIPLNMRIEFIKNVWVTWNHFQNFITTMNRNLSTKNKDDWVYLVNGYAMEENSSELDISWFIGENEHFLGPLRNSKRDQFLESLIDIRPTSQEMAYMLAIVSFRQAAKVLNGEFVELCENMIEILGDELHHYYKNHLHIEHYAFRIAQMMRILNILEQNENEDKKKIELARMFDVIHVDFSHPEMIYGWK